MSKKVAKNALLLIDYIVKKYKDEKFIGRANAILSERDKYTTSISDKTNSDRIEALTKSAYAELLKADKEEVPMLVKTEEFINEIFMLKAIVKDEKPMSQSNIDTKTPREQALDKLKIIKEKETEEQREKAMISYTADKMLSEAITMLNSIKSVNNFLKKQAEDAKKQIEENETRIEKIKESLIDPILRKFNITVEDIDKSAKREPAKKSRDLAPLQLDDDLPGQSIMNFEKPEEPHIVGDEKDLAPNEEVVEEVKEEEPTPEDIKESEELLETEEVSDDDLEEFNNSYINDEV